MKTKIFALFLTVLMSLSALIGCAQVKKYTDFFGYGAKYLRTLSDSAAGIPKDTFAIPSQYRAWPHLAARDTTLFMWIPSLSYWKEITSTTTTPGGGGAAPRWGDITGLLTNQLDLRDSLEARQRKLPQGSSLQYWDAQGALRRFDSLARVVGDTRYLKLVDYEALGGVIDSNRFLAPLYEVGGDVYIDYGLPTYNANRLQGYLVHPGEPLHGSYLRFDSVDQRWEHDTAAATTDSFTYATRRYVDSSESATTLTLAFNNGGTLGWSSSGNTRTLNLPNASGTTAGLMSTGIQSISGLKMFTSGVYAPDLRTNSSTSTPPALKAADVGYTTDETRYNFSALGGTGTEYKVLLGGGTAGGSVDANYNYTSVLLPNFTISENLSGTSPLIAQLAVKPLTVTAAAAATTNTALVYLDEPMRAGTNNYALWSRTGITKVDTLEANVIIGSGGSTPTLQQVLTAGATLTSSHGIELGANVLNFNGATYSGGQNQVVIAPNYFGAYRYNANGDYGFIDVSPANLWMETSFVSGGNSRGATIRSKADGTTGYVRYDYGGSIAGTLNSAIEQNDTALLIGVYGGAWQYLKFKLSGGVSRLYADPAFFASATGTNESGLVVDNTTGEVRKGASGGSGTSIDSLTYATRRYVDSLAVPKSRTITIAGVTHDLSSDAAFESYHFVYSLEGLMSGDGMYVALVNDLPSPAAYSYYGTDSNGVKGWHPLGTASGGGGDTRIWDTYNTSDTLTAARTVSLDANTLSFTATGSGALRFNGSAVQGIDTNFGVVVIDGNNTNGTNLWNDKALVVNGNVMFADGGFGVYPSMTSGTGWLFDISDGGVTLGRNQTGTANDNYFSVNTNYLYLVNGGGDINVPYLDERGSGRMVLHDHTNGWLHKSNYIFEFGRTDNVPSYDSNSPVNTIVINEHGLFLRLPNNAQNQVQWKRILWSAVGY